VSTRPHTAIRFLTAIIDWRRALLLLPVLAGVAVAVYFLAWRDGTGDTPRATLLDTAAIGGLEVGTRQGRVARDFAAFSPDGEPVRLSDLRGAPTIINFWATWCSSCVAELPDLRDLQAELGAERVRVLAVNVGESSDAARDFLDWLGASSLTVGMDPTLAVADSYGVRGMPQSVFVDSEGIIRAVYVGQLTDDALREYLASASQGVDQPDDTVGPLRFVTNVARERVLEAERLDGGSVAFSSKSLRCDDAYCAADEVDALAETPSVGSIERHLDADPAFIIVTFDDGATTPEELTGRLAALLNASDDPLYRTPLEVRER
jgi:thiol-disulfide isomerase/thioredoxin